jgi:hypothetical protein
MYICRINLLINQTKKDYEEIIAYRSSDSLTQCS